MEKLFRKYAETYTSPWHLVELSLGKVSKSPFAADPIVDFVGEVIKLARSYGVELHRSGDDRNDVAIDFRCMQLVLNLADDLEIGIGEYSPGVRV